MTDDDNEMRAIARTLFGPDEPAPEPEAPIKTGTNTVFSEGHNPAPEPSDDEYLRDFTRRMFNAEYAFTEPQLNEQD